MIHHVVMWKLREFSDESERRAAVLRIKTGLEGLCGVVDGLIFAEVHEGITKGGFDLCLGSELRDRAALEAYQTHPAHLVVKEFVHTVIAERASCDWES